MIEENNFLHILEILALIAGFMIASASFLYVSGTDYSTIASNAANVCDKEFILDYNGYLNKKNCYEATQEEHGASLDKINILFKLVLGVGTFLTIFIGLSIIFRLDKERENKKDLVIVLLVMSLCLTAILYALFHFLL